MNREASIQSSKEEKKRSPARGPQNSIERVLHRVTVLQEVIHDRDLMVCRSGASGGTLWLLCDLNLSSWLSVKWFCRTIYIRQTQRDAGEMASLSSFITNKLACDPLFVRHLCICRPWMKSYFDSRSRRIVLNFRRWTSGIGHRLKYGQPRKWRYWRKRTRRGFLSKQRRACFLSLEFLFIKNIRLPDRKHFSLFSINLVFPI